MQCSSLNDSAEWCNESYHDLNVNETKEMIVDFRRQGCTHRAFQIHNETMERVYSSPSAAEAHIF